MLAEVSDQIVYAHHLRKVIQQKHDCAEAYEGPGNKRRNIIIFVLLFRPVKTMTYEVRQGECYNKSSSPKCCPPSVAMGRQTGLPTLTR